MRSSKKLVEQLARTLDLCVATWSPGDGVTRYRFFHTTPAKGQVWRLYDGGGELVTCRGASEAHTWLDGYAVAYWKYYKK